MIAESHRSDPAPFAGIAFHRELPRNLKLSGPVRTARGRPGVDVSPDLVRAAKAGDEGALEDLISRSYRPAYTLALRLLRDPDDAAEATQEAYVRMVRGLKRFRDDGAFRTWMFKVVSNVCLTEMRRRSRRDVPVEFEAVPEASPADVEGVATGRVLRDELAVLVRGLPDIYRTAVVLRDVYELSTEETAEALGISPGAVKVRLHRARRMLREAFVARFPEWGDGTDQGKKRESA